MADDLECDICCEVYNEENRRPKNLPCGHTFCSHCMNREISDGNRNCATCRSPHKARSVSDLPTSVTLERMIRNKKSNKRQRTESNAPEDEEDEENGGRCLTHNKSFLYFHCETHSKKVCRECIVIDHRVDKCKVISFKQMVERQRVLGIQKVDENTRFIDDFIAKLGCTIEYYKKIESKQRHHIKGYQKEIDKATTKLNQAVEEQANAHKFMDKEESLRKSSDNAKLRLQNANTKRDVDKAVDEIEKVYEEIKNCTKNADRASKDRAKYNRYGECSSNEIKSPLLRLRCGYSDSDD